MNLPFQYYLSPSLFLLSQYFFPTASISIDLPRSKTCYLLLFYRSSHMFPRSSIFQFSSSHPALLFPLRYHLFLFRIPPPVHCSSQNDFSIGFISCANNLPNSYFSLWVYSSSFVSIRKISRSEYIPLLIFLYPKVFSAQPTYTFRCIYTTSSD